MGVEFEDPGVKDERVKDMSKRESLQRRRHPFVPTFFLDSKYPLLSLIFVEGKVTFRKKDYYSRKLSKDTHNRKAREHCYRVWRWLFNKRDERFLPKQGCL